MQTTIGANGTVVWRKPKKQEKKGPQFAAGHGRWAALENDFGGEGEKAPVARAAPFVIHELVAARRELGLTQKQLCAAVSFPKNRIRDIERGSAFVGDEKQRLNLYIARERRKREPIGH